MATRSHSLGSPGRRQILAASNESPRPTRHRTSKRSRRRHGVSSGHHVAESPPSIGLVFVRGLRGRPGEAWGGLGRRASRSRCLQGPLSKVSRPAQQSGPDGTIGALSSAGAFGAIRPLGLVESRRVEPTWADGGLLLDYSRPVSLQSNYYTRVVSCAVQ